MPRYSYTESLSYASALQRAVRDLMHAIEVADLVDDDGAVEDLNGLAEHISEMCYQHIMANAGTPITRKIRGQLDISSAATEPTSAGT